MAWNPSFSFKLRDDEITFGTLIFDKNCADMLCEELLRIKQGGHVSLDVIREILDKGCFTDTELDNAKAELEDIKRDIYEFKQMLTSRQRFEAWYGTTASTGAYIIGSQSWYQHYMSLKMTAADMYFKLVSAGEQFNQQAKDAYEKRYGEILRESSTKERTELALRRQFDENLANGVPNAREIYCEAMMVAGLMSQEQVDAHNKLFKAAGSSEVKSTIDNSKSNITISKLIDKLWLEVESHTDMLNKACAISTFVWFVEEIISDCNLEIKLADDDKQKLIEDFKDHKTSVAGELYASALSFKKYLSNGEHSEILSSTIIPYDNNEVENLLSSIRNISHDESNTPNKDIVINADTILQLYNEVLTISDAMKKALIISDLATGTIKILKDAEITCSDLWDKSIEDFLAGNGSAGTMIELAEALRNVLSIEANKNIINTYNLNDRDINYTKLTRQIEEAKG